MSFLLDTCVISELHKKRPEARVLRWLDAADEHDLHLSVLTFGELEKGIAMLPDAKRQHSIRNWVENDLVLRFQSRILPIDLEVSAEWGRLVGALRRRGKALPVLDGLLAATARVHRLTMVTRNVADFEFSGASLQNPWDA